MLYLIFSKLIKSADRCLCRTLILSLTLFGTFQASAVVIRGRVLNPNGRSKIDYMQYSLLQSRFDSILVNKNGTFHTNVSEKFQCQLLFKLQDQVVSIYVKAGDTVNILVDGKTDRLIKISGQTKISTKRLNYDIAHIISSERRRDSIFKFSIVPLTDTTEKYQRCGKLLVAELQSLNANRNILGSEFTKYVDELYFGVLNRMQGIGLSQFSKLDDFQYMGMVEKSHYEVLSKKLVLQSEQYRFFLFNYLRRGHRSSDDIYHSKFSNVQQFAPWIEYDRSKIIPAGFVQNWYIAKSLLFSFQHYDTNEAEKIMYEYFSQSKDNVFKPSVMNFWLGNVKFKSGRPAPAIKLRDNNNNIIQLSDYKGKIVYLNFWGVHCGPCLVQIDNYLGRLSQQQNSDKFVIINICLDENRVNWLDAVKKHKVPGVNLISSFGDTTAKNYNISSIPHYVLISTDGTIIDYSAPPPAELNSDNRILGAIIK
jgi:peroxiredoxin